MAPLTPPRAARKRRVASLSSGTDTPHLQRDKTIADPNLRDSSTVDPDHTGVSPNRSTEAPEDCKDASFLGLPCELLEIVASHLSGSKYIIELALVNKHVHSIVRKTMVRDLVVSKKHIKSCIDMLARHPDLMSCVTSVDLSNFGCDHTLAEHDCDCLGTPNFKPDVSAIIGRTITRDSRSAITWTQIRDAKYTRGTVWRKQQAFFLDVLMTLCPNIKSVTLELPAARRFDMGAPPRPIYLAPNPLPGLNLELIPAVPFHGPALQVLRQRLEVLTIAEDTTWKGPATCEILEGGDTSWRNMGKLTVTLSEFPKLRCLDIPMEALGHPETILFVDPIANAVAPGDSTIRTKVLPLTLQSLHLRSCNKWTFTLLQKINEVPMNQLRLKRIELSFKADPGVFLTRCDSADQGRLSYLRVLSDLRRKGTKVVFYTGDIEEVLDMSKELASLSALSPFEAWRFSISRMPFSVLNLVASKTRRISETASRLFLRHAENHLSFFNSSTLDLGRWTQGAFFHGIKNTKWDPALIDRTKVTSIILPGDWERRPLGKREGKRRLPVLLSKVPGMGRVLTWS
jgi:hypothetical protein